MNIDNAIIKITNALLILITGKSAAANAIFDINVAGILAIKIRSGAIGGMIAEIKPKIVTGATKGAANTFAKIEVIER